MLRHGISPHFCLRKNVFVEIEIEWSEVEKIEMVFVEMILMNEMLFYLNWKLCLLLLVEVTFDWYFNWK